MKRFLLRFKLFGTGVVGFSWGFLGETDGPNFCFNLSDVGIPANQAGFNPAVHSHDWIAAIGAKFN